MTPHRWSGWSGAWCLDCGCEDPFEIALAEDKYVEVDDNSEHGFHFEFPDVVATDCPEPNSKRHDPYARSR